MLGRGLSKRSEAVKRVVEKEMIPGLLSLSNNNIAHHLAVGNSDTLYMELVSSVHLTRGEDMLQSYDPNKKNNNILESSSNAVHNNYAHLKEVKMLAELLLQNVKEKSCVR